MYASMEKGKIMIIDLSSALKHPGQSFPFSVEGNIGDIELYGDLIKFKNPVQVVGTIMYTSKNFFVTGSLDFEYTTSCALCFKDVDESIDCDFNEEFAQEEDIAHPDRYTFTGNTIDITKMTMDIICLNLPLKHLCSEECKGLCPKCGHNLNESPCKCDINVEQSNFDNEVVLNKKENPFAVLENLFSDEDEEA